MSDGSQESWIIDAIKSLGVPSAILVVITLAMWKAGSWTGDNILTPLVQRQIKFMDELGNAQQSQTRTLEAVADSLNEIQKTTQAQQRLLERITNDDK